MHVKASQTSVVEAGIEILLVLGESWMAYGEKFQSLIVDIKIELNVYFLLRR
jgi:hypothetical protein